MSNTSDKYVFWIDDPTILYKNDKYMVMIPNNSMSRIEQLNAMTRFFVYFLIILLIFGILDGWIFVPLVGIIFIIILYYIYRYDPEGKLKETLEKRSSIDNNFKDKVNYEKQSKHNDADGKLNIGKEYIIHTNNTNNLVFSTDEILDHQNAVCKKPTKDNPFMNPIIMDYNTFNPPLACNIDDDEIKEYIENSFNNELYMNFDDLFNIKNSQRIWYTIPMPAIPPDQIAFGNWLSKPDVTCKQDQEMCTRHYDLRYGR